MYIENNQLHMAAYHFNDTNPDNLWGYKRVSTQVAPNTYIMDLKDESQDPRNEVSGILINDSPVARKYKFVARRTNR